MYVEREELVSHKGRHCPFRALFSWMQVFGSQAEFAPSHSIGRERGSKRVIMYVERCTYDLLNR